MVESWRCCGRIRIAWTGCQSFSTGRKDRRSYDAELGRENERWLWHRAGRVGCVICQYLFLSFFFFVCAFTLSIHILFLFCCSDFVVVHLLCFFFPLTSRLTRPLTSLSCAIIIISCRHRLDFLPFCFFNVWAEYCYFFILHHRHIYTYSQHLNGLGSQNTIALPFMQEHSYSHLFMYLRPYNDLHDLLSKVTQFV